jgi:hypothetical protein
MAITLQFYLFCPLLLWLIRTIQVWYNGKYSEKNFFMTLTWACVTSALASIAHRLYVSKDLSLPAAYYSEEDVDASLRYNAYVEALYHAMMPRLNVLAAGALVAVFLRSRQSLAPSILGVASLVLQLTILGLTLFVRWRDINSDPWPRRSTVIYTALLWCGSPLYALAAAVSTLGLVFQTDRMHSGMSYVLNTKILRWIASLSTVSYFLHIQAMYACMVALDEYSLHGWWRSLLDHEPIHALHLLGAMTVIMTLLSAHVYNSIGSTIKRTLKSLHHQSM